MNISMISKAIELVKQVTELTKAVIDSADPEKYAKSVNSLNSGVSDTYEQMRLIIINSEKFTEEEKLARLQELSEQEQASKEKCAEAIKGNREHVAKIAMEVVKGLLTCGISFAPEIAKKMKTSLSNEDREMLLEANEPILIEETSNT